MTLDVPQLVRPAGAVHTKRLVTPRRRQPIESGLDDGEGRSAGGLSERELDERHGLGRVIHVRVDGMRVPAIGEEPFRLDALDEHLDRQMVVVGDRDAAAHGGSGRELALELGAEPRPELFGRRECPPHLRARRFQKDRLLDAIGSVADICNLSVAS